MIALGLLSIAAIIATTVLDVRSTRRVRVLDALNPRLEAREWKLGWLYAGNHGLVLRSIVGALAAFAVALASWDSRFAGHGWLWIVGLVWSGLVVIAIVRNNANARRLTLKAFLPRRTQPAPSRGRTH